MRIFKTLLSAILIVLMLTPLCTIFVGAADDVYVPTDPYVYHYGVAGNGYTGPNLQYFSAYMVDYKMDGGYTQYISSTIFTLYNSKNGQIIPAYCTDIDVGARTGNYYRRINLEDSTYAGTAAGQLRAIVNHGFYLEDVEGESTADHENRVTAKLKAIGEATGIPDLTIGEAIAATQTAIWRTAHGTRLEFTDFLRTIYNNKIPSATKYYDICNVERNNGHVVYTTSTYGQITIDPDSDVYINHRISTVYNYLISLEPMDPVERAVSPSSFTKLQEPSRIQNSDGTYDVSVTARVDVDMHEEDSLILSAVIDDTHFVSTPLSDGEQVVTLTIENVPAALSEEAVYLNIDGYQTVSDVFLFDAHGDRNVSQSMVAPDSSQMPVHASIEATSERILSIYKTTVVSNENNEDIRHPLQGIIFDVYFVASMQDYESGEKTLPDPDNFIYPTLPDYIIVTDKDGRGRMNITEHGMSDGAYLVVERAHPAIEAPVDPFYIILPYNYEYEILVQPKNNVKGNVSANKDSSELGSDNSSADVYANNRWIVATNVPVDIANGIAFTMTDTLDNRLDYAGNVEVRLESVDGTEIFLKLAEGVDFTNEVHDFDSTSDGKPSDSFLLSLTPAGMANIATAIGTANYDDYMIRIYYETRINSNASAGEAIPNKAIINYTNSVNFTFKSESDEPTVSTGGINLIKVDSKNHNKFLPGATFEVYRVATAHEIADQIEGITHIPGVTPAVIKVAFFDNESMSGEKVYSATSDENGRVMIYGLAYGDYYVHETSAPNGYNELQHAVAVKIDSVSHMEDKMVMIQNDRGLSLLPQTGGIGTRIFTISGIVLILASFILLCAKKRMENE